MISLINGYMQMHTPLRHAAETLRSLPQVSRVDDVRIVLPEGTEAEEDDLYDVLDALQQHCGRTLVSFRLISQCQPRNTGTTLRFQSLAMYLLFFWDIQQFQLTWHYPIQITDIDDVRPMWRWCAASSLREFAILGSGTHKSTVPINDCLNFFAKTCPNLEYLRFLMALCATSILYLSLPWRIIQIGRAHV